MHFYFHSPSISYLISDVQFRSLSHSDNPITLHFTSLAVTPKPCNNNIRFYFVFFILLIFASITVRTRAEHSILLYIFVTMTTKGYSGFFFSHITTSCQSVRNVAHDDATLHPLVRKQVWQPCSGGWLMCILHWLIKYLEAVKDIKPLFNQWIKCYSSGTF